MKRINTSKKQNKRRAKPVKPVVSQEPSLTLGDGTVVPVKSVEKALNPDAYKYREDKAYNKKIAEIREMQEKFYNNVVLTSVFLNVMSGNPDEFQFLIGGDVKEHYQFKFENPEWVAEAIDEMCNDVAFGEKKFVINHNGLFPHINFAKKRQKAATIDDIVHAMVPYMGAEWGI